MGKVIIIIIFTGIMAGIASIILDGVPQANFSVIIFGIISFLILLFLMSLLSRTNESNDNDGNGGGGGIEFVIEPQRPPSGNRNPQLPSGGDDEIIDAEVTDVPRYLSVRERKLKYLETTKEYEKKFQPDRKKVNR